MFRRDFGQPIHHRRG